MSDLVAKTYERYVLPSSVVTKIDISRLVSEAEWVDNEMTAAAVRNKAATAEQTQPVISGQLTEFLSQNQLSIHTNSERSSLLKQLRLLKEKAPVLHMTFAVTADMESLQQLVSWVRSSIHPQAVIAVGLQPALVAGVYLRTPNHVLDLSVRGALEGRHGLLVQELESLRGSK
jgi:transcriptional regulator NrdR family protein